MEARRLQALEKESRMQEQARQERDEFQRIVEAQKILRDNELRLEKEKTTMVLYILLKEIEKRPRQWAEEANGSEWRGPKAGGPR